MRWARGAVLAIVAAAATAAHADFSGKVVGVLDGDTIDVLLGDQRQVRVRLAEIDAPEKKQPWGMRSKQTLSDAVFGQVVTVVDHGPDWRGKRTVGGVRLNGRDINRFMVSEGMAWVYRRYLSDRTLLLVEAKARAERRGLWVDAAPVPPWEWRREAATEYVF